MAGKDFTTKNSKEWPTTEEIQKVIDSLKTVRAIGDLLTAAADTLNQGRYELHENTLENIGMHLEDMATEGLVILRHEEPRKSSPQVAAPEDWELDPVTKENLLKDLEKLQDMGSKIQLAAECMCNDLGLEFPPNIKERIAKEHAAPAAGVQGGES